MKKIIIFVTVVLSTLLAGLYHGWFMGVSISPAIHAAENPVSPRNEHPLKLFEKPRPQPRFHFVDGEKNSLTLADFRGKVILLNIWATWCPPCRKEMPSLDRLQTKLGGPDFQVLPLSIDEGGPSVVKRFYNEIGIKSLDVFLGPSDKISAELKIIGLPTTFLIDRKGMVLGVKIGPAEWDSESADALIQEQLGFRGQVNS